MPTPGIAANAYAQLSRIADPAGGGLAKTIGNDPGGGGPSRPGRPHAGDLREHRQRGLDIA